MYHGIITFPGKDSIKPSDHSCNSCNSGHSCHSGHSCQFDRRYLCMSSALFGLSSLVLFYFNNVELALFTIILCMTSINHWRDYKNGSWRQWMDLVWIKIYVLYLFYDSFIYRNEYHRYVCLSSLFCVILFYQISLTECSLWPIFHMAIHIYAAFFIPFIYHL